MLGLILLAGFDMPFAKKRSGLLNQRLFLYQHDLFLRRGEIFRAVFCYDNIFL